MRTATVWSVEEPRDAQEADLPTPGGCVCSLFFPWPGAWCKRLAWCTFDVWSRSSEEATRDAEHTSEDT